MTQEIEKIKLELETYKDGLVDINKSAEQIRTIAFNAVIPSLDLLQAKLEAGCKIVEEDSWWCLFDKDGKYVTSGDTLRLMILNLIILLAAEEMK